MPAKRSPLLDKLYGTELAKEVFSNIEKLDSELNNEVQEIAYEHYWARPGLTIRDKSLVTLTSLITLGKEKQTKPHMLGFLNTGGTYDELLLALSFLSKKLDAQRLKHPLKLFWEVLKSRKTPKINIDQLKISFKKYAVFRFNMNRDLTLVEIASDVAIGKASAMERSMKKGLKNKTILVLEIKNTLIHQIVYCGFPTAINGFSALKSTVAKLK